MKTRQSKNRKKGWKKVDIADVEDAIEDERIQERTGGLVAEKSNAELFFIDDEGKSNKPTTTDTTSKGRRKRADKPLKCYSILEPNPKIPAISRQVSGHSKQNLIKASQPVNRKLVKTLEERRHVIQRNKAKLEDAKKVHQEAYDLWADDSNKLDEHFAVVTKKKRVKAPNTLFKKPSTIAAVEAPHPGSSYNPAFADHQELLQKAVVRQVKEDVAEAKLQRKVTPNYGVEGPPTRESYMNEMSQGLGLDEKDQSDEASGEEEDGEFSVVSKKQPKLKTKKQRRKQKERLKEQLNKLREKEDRMWKDRNSSQRLKSIAKQVELREKLLEEQAAKRKSQRQQSVDSTRRLGKKKFEELEEDVLLTTDLKGSLRLTRSNNTLLDDRFRSLQKRNIIEPRSRAKFRRKYKPKFAEKKPFKEITAKSRAGGGIIIPFHQRKHNEKE